MMEIGSRQVARFDPNFFTFQWSIIKIDSPTIETFQKKEIKAEYLDYFVNFFSQNFTKSLIGLVFKTIEKSEKVNTV